MEENPKSFKLYLERIKKLVNSIVIKIDEIYVHQAYNNYYKKHKQIPKREESKYYLNLSGKRHKDDPEVKITVDGETYNFDKELLKKRPDIKSILLTYGNDFKKLVNNNPSMYTYIVGCLCIDKSIKELIDTENYTILYYNKNFLEDRELELIYRLEEFIKKFFYNYNVSEYMIDELYLPSLLSILYNQLFLQCLTYKFDNILSYKADKYHLYNYLASFNNIDKHIDMFKDNTKYYVYGELNRIKTNIGQNATLDKLLNKILSPNRIGVVNITTRINYTIDKKLINNIETLPIKKETELITKDVNNATIIENNRKIELEQIVGLEKDNNYITTGYEVNENIIKSELNRLDINTQTKSLLLDTPLRLKIYEINSLNLVISNILYLSRYSDNGFYFTYMDTYNKKIYNLDREDIYYIIIYLLLQEHELLNIEDDIYITLDGIVDILEINKDNIVNSTWYKKEIDKIVDFLISDERLTLLPLTKKDFIARLSAVRRIDFIVSYLLSNITDSTLKNDIKLMVNKLYLVKKIKIDKNEIFNYINNKNLTSMVKNVTLKDFLEDLFLEYDGIKINTREKAIGKLRKIINFSKKMTSYNIQFLIDYDLFDGCSIRNYKNGVSHGYKPYMEVKDGLFRLFERLDYIVKTYGSDDVDKLLYNDWLFNDFDVIGEKVDVRRIKPVVVKNRIDYPLLLGNIKHRQPIYRTESKEKFDKVIDSNNVNVSKEASTEISINNTKVDYLKPVTGSNGIYNVLTASMSNWGHVTLYRSRLGNDNYSGIPERDSIQLTSESKIEYDLTPSKHPYSIGTITNVITDGVIDYYKEGFLRKQTTTEAGNEAITSEFINNNYDHNINITNNEIKELDVKTFFTDINSELVATDAYGYVKNVYSTRNGGSINGVDNLIVTNYSTKPEITTTGEGDNIKPTTNNIVNTGLVGSKYEAFNKLYSVDRISTTGMNDIENVITDNRNNVVRNDKIDDLRTYGGYIDLNNNIYGIAGYGYIDKVYGTRHGDVLSGLENDSVKSYKNKDIGYELTSSKNSIVGSNADTITNDNVETSKKAFLNKQATTHKTEGINETDKVDSTDKTNTTNVNKIDNLRTKGGNVGMTPLATSINAFGKVHEVYKTRDGGNTNVREKDNVDQANTNDVKLTTKSDKEQTTLVDNDTINDPGVVINKRAYGKKTKSTSKSTSVKGDDGLKYVNVDLTADKVDGKHLTDKTAGPDTNPDEIDVLLTSEKISD